MQGSPGNDIEGRGVVHENIKRKRMSLLEIKNLHANVDNHEILKGST